MGPQKGSKGQESDTWEETKTNKSIGATGVKGAGGKAFKQLKTTRKGKINKSKGSTNQLGHTASDGNSEFEGHDKEKSVNQSVDSLRKVEEKKQHLRQRLTRSMDTGEHIVEDEKLDQEVEEPTAYDLTEVEVIDVNAEDATTNPKQVINNPEKLKRQEIAKLVRKEYGKELVIFDAMDDFLLSLIGGLETSSEVGQKDATHSTTIKYADHIGQFTIICMYYMQFMAKSQLFLSLTEKNITKKGIKCHFNQKNLMYNARFQLCHVKYEPGKKLTHGESKVLSLKSKKISTFFKDIFNSLMPKERQSIMYSFEKGDALYIIGFDITGKIHHVIAAILYVLAPEGSYINWFAVTHQSYNHDRFGRGSNDQPFCNMGLESFLLQVVQLQAVTRGYSSTLYLQANMSTEAFLYFHHCGFKKMDENDPELLPERLNSWYLLSKQENGVTPCVNFVTNKQNKMDAKRNKEDPDSPEARAKFFTYIY